MDPEHINSQDAEDLEDCDENPLSYEELLIMAVRDRPCVWDQRIDVRFRGIDATKQAWNEISEILNTGPKLVQKKWKNLLDTFRRKHEEQKSYVPSGRKAAKRQVQWKFYQPMKFLLPTIQFEKTFGNCSKVNSDAGQGTARSQSLTATTIPLSQPLERTVLQRPLSMKSSPPPRRRRAIKSPLNISTTPPRSASPALSMSPDVQERRRRSSSGDSNELKRTREDENFVNILTQISKKPSEEQAFCSYLQCRLEKLQRKDFVRITNTILLEVMKVEAEQNEEQV